MMYVLMVRVWVWVRVRVWAWVWVFITCTIICVELWREGGNQSFTPSLEIVLRRECAS